LSKAQFELGPGEIHVWIGTARPPGSHRFDLDRHLDALDATERERAARRKDPGQRGRFLAARVMQRLVPSWYVPGVAPRDWRFEAGAHGRPRFAAQFDSLGLHFNLSHTQDHLALAVAREPVIGVDIEKIEARASLPRIAARYFTSGEAQALAALPPGERPRRFFGLWTLKEAWLKATGEGLGAGLHNAWFTLSATHELERVHLAADDAARWRFWRYNLRTHALAVAARTEDDPAGLRLSLKDFPYRPVRDTGAGSGEEEGAET
jgi:4'-phosphopantetheinyl transferase